jgi:hypothetical protein
VPSVFSQRPKKAVVFHPQSSIVWRFGWVASWVLMDCDPFLLSRACMSESWTRTERVWRSWSGRKRSAVHTAEHREQRWAAAVQARLGGP